MGKIVSCCFDKKNNEKLENKIDSLNQVELAETNNYKVYIQPTPNQMINQQLTHQFMQKNYMNQNFGTPYNKFGLPSQNTSVEVIQNLKQYVNTNLMPYNQPQYSGPIPFSKKYFQLGKKPLDTKDSVKGCIIGALLGDAAGSYLEFSGLSNSIDAVNKALSLEGGGTHKTGPGQVTDDGELTLCLAHALVEGNGKLDLKIVIKYYAKWIQSQPFDAGFTTRAALNYAQPNNPNPKTVREAAAQYNQNSQSNGSLMRITPLAVWIRKLKKEIQIDKVVREEVILTHPNEIAQQASICYCLAIRSLINSLGDRKKAYEEAKTWAMKHGKQELKEYFGLIESSENVNCQMHEGYLKIAFTYSFKFLLSEKNYVEALEEMLMKGGDTDTNSCILGGMMGAAVGFSNIPPEMSSKILNWNSQFGGVQRPDFLIPSRHILGLIDRLYDQAPTSLIIENGSDNDK